MEGLVQNECTQLRHSLEDNFEYFKDASEGTPGYGASEEEVPCMHASLAACMSVELYCLQ
jgi:hypothetical protein